MLLQHWDLDRGDRLGLDKVKVQALLDLVSHGVGRTLVGLLLDWELVVLLLLLVERLLARR